VRLRGNEIGHAAFNVLFLGLLGWALVWFFTSELFYINQIVVTGNQRISADIIREVSGLEGFSVFWINSQHVADNIVQSLPPIESAQLRYGLSDGRRLAATTTLTVQEQSEQLIWQVAGQRYWVDDEGTLRPAYGEAEQVPAAAAASSVDLVVNDTRPGPPDQVDQEALDAARQLIRLLPEVQAVEYAPLTGLRLHHPRGWLVYLGTGSDMARKVNVLRALEVEFAGEDTIRPALIDLRFPDSPYYRLPADTNHPADANHPADTNHPADDANAGFSVGGG
jgi:cell division septal protein FtsQ